MIRLSIALLSVLCLTVGSAGGAPAPARPKVSLELKRSGFAYKWEYTVTVRVRAGATGKPIPSLRVVAAAEMNAPGHHMETGPTRLTHRGDGVHRARIAFYMPGKWVIRVSVRGADVVPSTTRFDRLLE